MQNRLIRTKYQFPPHAICHSVRGAISHQQFASVVNEPVKPARCHANIILHCLEDGETPSAASR